LHLSGSLQNAPFSLVYYKIYKADCF
jgi:hypothetical protein